MRRAREAWLAENYDILRAIALSLGFHGTYSAEDALHDALIYGFDYINPEEPDKANRNRIMAKVKFLLIDNYRRSHKHKCIPLEGWNGSVDDLEERLVALLEYEELQKRIGRVTPPRYREILEYQVQERTQREIAAELGLSVAAVKSRLFRARKKLEAVA